MPKIYKSITYTLLLFLTSCDLYLNPTNAKIIENDLCLYSCSTGTNKDNFLSDHEVIILSSNKETKFARWVAYLVKKENLQPGTKHKRNWKQDPNIPSEYTLIPTDYKGAYAKCDFDRGHQAPLASFAKSEEWFVTNYLSNVTPQKKDLNRGAWLKLETAVRKLAKKHNEVFVVTGPYYTDKKICLLPVTRIKSRIPNGYWKIIAIKEGDKVKMAGFSFPQETARKEGYCKHSKNLEQIENISDLKFFGKKPDIKLDSLLREMGC